MLLVNFMIGGVIVSTASYFGSQAKGLAAAMVAMLPSLSVVTLCIIYSAAGANAATSYAKGMLIILPSWVIYVVGVIILLPRMGLWGSLAVSISAYLLAAFLMTRLFGFLKV